MLNATTRDMGPTLPRYMVTIIISFPQRFSMEVRFLLNPTVAVALTVSYNNNDYNDFNKHIRHGDDF